MTYRLKRGSTSQRRLIFIGDSSSTTGAGLANLTHASSGLVAYYFASDLNNEVQITLASATLGTFTSGGFVAVDNTNMPGWYEIGIPDAALDGGSEVAIQLRGATNMVPVNIYVGLDAIDYQVDALGAVKPTTAGRTLDISAGGEAGIDWANIGSPTTSVNFSGSTISTSQQVASVTGAVGSVTASVSVTNLTVEAATTLRAGSHYAQSGDAYGLVGVAGAGLTALAPAATALSSAVWTTTKAGYLDAAISSRSSHSAADVWSVGTRTLSAFGFSVTVGTNNDKTGYSLTQTFPANFASLGITSSGYVSRVVLVDTTTTNSDMRGTDGAALATNWTATRAGYLDHVLQAANSNRTVQVTGSQHIAADMHESQPDAIHATTFEAGSIDSTAIAADAITAAKIASDVGTEIGSAVWASASRTLTSGANIVLAKGTGLTGLNDLSAADIRTATGLGSANLDSQLAAIKSDSAAILDDTGNVGVVVASGSKTGYSLSATGTDLVLIDGKTLAQAMQIIAATTAGKITGAGTSSEVFKGLDGITTRVTVTADESGNRTSVSYT